jgi:hypothetical protein
MDIHDDHERQVCPDCGLAYTDERQHRDWHVDQRMKRLPPADADAAFWMFELNARLNALEVSERRRIQREAQP